MSAAGPLPDPRPQVVAEGEAHLLEGVRCVNGHPLLARFHRCPRCGADVAPERFGPEGTIWSYTVMHVPSRPDEEVPYMLAYLDLEEGPRLLVRLEGERPATGDRARLVAPSALGDPRAEVLG